MRFGSATTGMSVLVSLLTMGMGVDAAFAPSLSSSSSSSRIVESTRAAFAPVSLSFASPSMTTMSSSTRIASSSAKASELVSTDGDKEEESSKPTIKPEFEKAREQVMKTLKASIESKTMLEGLSHFVSEYFTACSASGAIDPEVTTKNMMNAIQYGIQHGITDQYIFGVTHKALRGDKEKEDGNEIDYYQFGCDFFRPCMDYDNSVVLGEDNLQNAMDQISKGENVVFFANHQSEADPQVMSIMLEKAGFGKQAEDLVYVAGHKVTTDTLAIPFSMGRNLICIHSKKHIDSDPETKPVKTRQNLSAMSGMLKMLVKGGASIWVAPSGGRDRRDIDSNEVPIAPFDQKTIDMFRLMGNKSKTPTHYYAISMVSYELCPPPDFVEAGVGEQRNVRFVPVGIACSKELENVGGVESRHLFTDHALEVCNDGYNQLLSAIEKK